MRRNCSQVPLQILRGLLMARFENTRVLASALLVGGISCAAVACSGDENPAPSTPNLTGGSGGAGAAGGSGGNAGASGSSGTGGSAGTGATSGSTGTGGSG